MLEIVRNSTTIYFKITSGTITPDILEEMNAIGDTEISLHSLTMQYINEEKQKIKDIDVVDVEKCREKAINAINSMIKSGKLLGHGYSLSMSGESNHRFWFMLYQSDRNSTQEEIDYIINKITSICDKSNIKIETDVEQYKFSGFNTEIE